MDKVPARAWHCQPGGLFFCPRYQSPRFLDRLALVSKEVSSPSHADQGVQDAFVWSSWVPPCLLVG